MRGEERVHEVEREGGSKRGDVAGLGDELWA